MAEPNPEHDDIKKRATRRLLVAVALVAIAVGILTWYSQYKPTRPVTTRPSPETIVTAPVVPPESPPIIAAPGEPAPTPTAPPTGQEPAPPSNAKPAPPPTLGPPPPPRVSSEPLPPPGPGPQKEAETAAEKPLVKAEQTPAPLSAQPATTPAPAAAPAPSGYVVQFGVFSNPKNATQLVEHLKQLGIAAHTETHVQLGPFKTKAEADAALEKMKGKGISAVVVPR